MNLFRVWNRRVHFYVGLYFLFFTWLFAFTGLILNHSWHFAEFYPNRKITTFDRVIEKPPSEANESEKAAYLGQLLGLHGEIATASPPPGVPGRFDFTVSRPGHVDQIQADLVKGRAHVTANDYNVWGVMHVLHTFTGLSATDQTQKRDWILTNVWIFAMDALAVGLIVMVLSSYYMWWVLPHKRAIGAGVLTLGCFSCALFVFGLRWIYS